ncbi:putative RING-H2 finger protein ATL21A [Corylus avellana]|uniref:putative RING-H2 finger protein ATL21A n=1 Tax=Corylus avellana TaxID=13451 RepID=UPI00286A90D1|nr:putative RING-H2 finger protein ATL21A [Corylus avellana]
MASPMLFPAGLIVLIVILVLVPQACSANDSHYHCPASSCGNIHNISYPFRLKGDPPSCGDQRYNLSCENNQTVLYLYVGKYYVQEIDYNNYTIRVVDPGVLNDNDSFIPRYSLSYDNFSSADPYEFETYNLSFVVVVLVNCEKPVLNSLYYLNISACSEDGVYSSKRYRYVLFSPSPVDLEDLCQVEQISTIPWSDRSFGDLGNISCTDFHNELRAFELSWYQAYCPICRNGYCYHNHSDNSVSCYGFDAEPPVEGAAERMHA